MKRVYFEGGYTKVLENVEQNYNFNKSELSLWKFPTDDEVSKMELSFTHWSYFEPWDSYRNYVTAKKFCGLKEKKESNSGTFTNFAQNDQALYSLHAYMMYLKFGFGRATQDACIEVRRGSMTRDQAITLVNLYDHEVPKIFIKDYLKYYNFDINQLGKIFDKFANKKILEKKGKYWKKKFKLV